MRDKELGLTLHSGGTVFAFLLTQLSERGPMWHFISSSAGYCFALHHDSIFRHADRIARYSESAPLPYLLFR